MRRFGSEGAFPQHQSHYLPPEERSEFRGLPLGGGVSSTSLRQAPEQVRGKMRSDLLEKMALGGPHPALKTMPGSGQTGIVQSRARSAASRLKPLTRQFQPGALLGKGFRDGSARRGDQVLNEAEAFGRGADWKIGRVTSLSL
jgi:hypothetical protein